MTPIIKTTAAMKIGLAAIQREIESGNDLRLYATDIMLNVREERYFPAATAGVCTPIAYDDRGTAKAFFNILTRTATDGQDIEFQPHMKMSEPCRALLFTRNKTTPTDEANTIVRDIPEAMPFDELLCTVHAAIEETGARLVIIDDVTGYVRGSGRAMLCDLNELANTCNVLLFAGFMLTNEDEETSRCLAPYAPQLWQLTTKSLIMLNDDNESSREQPYFCLSYGGIDPKRIVCGIDNEGNADNVRDLVKLLRIKELAKALAPKWIKQTQFTDICYGATDGEFIKNSIVKSIDVAVHNGYIQKCGSGNKTRLCFNGEKMSRAVYGENIALTAKGNPYTSQTHTKVRKPILRHGEFRLIAPENGTDITTMQYFVIGMMKAVVHGVKWLDFDVKTQYRNTLAILVGTDEKRLGKVKDKVAAIDGATFEAITLPKDITDEAFLTAYKQAIDSLKPNFVFIISYDHITPQHYTEAQLAKELAIHSKRKGICTIAETNTPIDLFDLDLKDEYWSISRLVNEDDTESIFEEHGICISTIYSFQGSVEDFDFLCRFENRGKEDLVQASSSEQLRAFLIGTFYDAKNTAAYDIETDCTGRPLTENVIRQAQKAKLISVRRYGKNWMDSIITFKGEK